jgi:hypothetical protein
MVDIVAARAWPEVDAATPLPVQEFAMRSRDLTAG